MCDCFHLVLPNWQGSPASASGRQLRPEDTEADGEADAEDDSISEVTTESIRPRPQGSSPVYEYCIEDEYFNKKLQQDIENRQRRDSTFKMSGSQESMEVTLQTEVESGASGFSVAGGGAEGIFVKQVLKETPASNLFSLKEGDQLLSATIFFDNIKYEDALKILQYSEPYKVQFNLKRKLLGKDELEAIHSATQSKKEKLSQGMDIMEISEKTISEEDKANLIVKQRVGRQKRTKKDRLSWPKFQSIKGKKISGHRRSRSTSDAYEHGIPDVSPTSTDTESQFQPEEIHGKIKKQSQKKLKFPTIGFKMHKKQEPYEINPFKEYENDTTVELSEIMTREYTSLDVDRKPKEKEPKRGVSETVFPLPQHTRKYPDVELTITKSKEKKLKSNLEFTKQEPTVATTQMKTAVIQTKDIADSQIKVSHNVPKMRKKKQKDSKVQIEKDEKGKVPNIASKYALPQIESPKVEVDIKIPKMDFSLPKADHKATKPELKMEEITADINISELDKKSTARQGILELKTTDQETNITSDEIPADGSGITLEDDENKFKMLKLQMPKFGISLPKQKGIPQGELSISSMEADFPKTALKTELTTSEIEADIKLTDVQIEAPSLDVEITEKGKIKMPALKMPTVKVAKLKAPEVGISMTKVETDVNLPKGKAEVSEGAAAIKLPEAEGTIDGGGLKIHKPKFKMPSMGFSKPEIQGPKVDVDVSMPKVDISLPEAKFHVEKPEVKGGDITISAPEVKIPTGSASLELKAPEVDVEAPTGKVSVQGPDGKLESGDRKFQMPKFHMPKFGISLPKGKGIPEAEISVPSVEADIPKTELKAEVTLSSAKLETDLQFPQVEVDAPSLDVDVGDKGKIKMPEMKMPSVKVPKLKGPEVGISLPKVETDITLPKGKVEVSEGAAAVKLPEAEGTIDGGGLKIHKPKFKMPSMGFSKPDIKGPKVDVDASMPKVDISLPEAKLHVEKPEVKDADIIISAPEVKIPTGSASLELEAPEVDIEALTGKVSVQGPDVKLESGDRKFQMPKFHMPKFGISLPKGKGVTEADITVPSMEAVLPKCGLEITMPSAELEADIKLPKVEAQTRSLEMDIGEKGKITMPLALQQPKITLERGETTFKIPKFHMPKFEISVPQEKEVQEGETSIPSLEADLHKTGLKAGVILPSAEIEADIKLPKGEVVVPRLEIEVGDMGNFKIPGMKMSSVKAPKLEATEVGISIPKVETDISVSKQKIEVPHGSATIELPETETTTEGGGMRIHMPKFKMPSMGFSKPDIKGPKVDVDVSMPKVDISLPEAKLNIEKPEVKEGDITISAPEVKIPTGSASLEMKDPELDVEAPTGKVSVQGADGKLESGDRKFQMPKFHMPKFGISLPKGKGIPEAEISVPSVEADIPKTELKAEMTLPSAEFETDVQLPQVEVDAPSLDVDVGDKGKIKMPEVKMPSVKVPKLKGPEVAISLPKVETDVTLPKGKVEVSEGAAAIKLPEAEGTIDGGGLKIHKPKFKMPSMGFSKPDIKGPQVDVDVSMPKVDISLPEAKLHVEKPEVKEGDITISAPEVTIPTGSASLELKAPEVDVEAPTGKVSVQGPDVKLESRDRKFQMPKFHMPKFGISLPKGKGIPEAEISVPSVEADIPKTELKAEVTLPSAELETDLQLPQVEVDAPSLDVDTGDKGKIKMPEVKMPSVKVPKLKGPEVGISLPKVETDVTLPKGKVEGSEGAAAVKLPEAEGTIDGGGLKIHMPKFKMPSMGFSKPDIKGPKVDVDVSMPKVDISLPEAKLHVEKPEVKGGDITISAPEVRIPTGSASLELKAPEVDVEVPTGKVSVQGPDGKLESGDRKFQMPKFHMPKFGISLPKGKGIPEAEISVPSVEADIPKTELKAEVTLPSAELETDLQLPQVEVDAPSLDIDIGGKGKIKMPEVKMPSVKVPKLKGPEVGISLPKVETDVTLPKGKVEVSEGAAAVKLPEAEGTIDGGGLKIHKPKFKMPSMGFSKPDIKGPKVDVDVSMPKVDISLPEGMLHVEKPEVKGGDITISAPEVKIPTGSASLEMEAPELDIEAPTGKVSVQGPDGKLESGDRKFQMPKFHMPKFGISLPKGKGIPEAEISVPSVEADIPKTEFKAEVTLPSAELETDVQFPQVEVDAPSLDIDIGGKGKIKMPEVKMPSVKVPKLKGPEVGISLPKVETDVTLPKGKVEVSEGAVAIKLPEAEGTIDGGGLKMHKPKFKMPSMGFSKPDIKGPKVDVDVSMPKVDISLPEAKLHVEKPEVKGGNTTISAPEVKIPTGSASLEMEAAELDVEAPTGKVSLQGPDCKLETADRKFQMPKFHMPKFGISLPKGKGIPEAEISVPSVEADIPKTELKAEVTLPSAELETDLQLPQVEVDAPSLDIDIGGKGKIKMPEVKMPSVKVPKLKGPEVGISLPKVETDVTLPKGKVEVSEGAAAVKLPEAEGTIDGGGLKMHKPKFKMPSMGFSKPDIKGPKVDVDVSMPKVDISLPEAKLHVEKPEVKGGDTTISAPEVKIPTGSASLEMEAAELDVEAPTGKVSLQGPDCKLETADRKFQMPKFHMPKFGISLPKGKGIPEAEISVPSVEADIPKTELKAEVTLPSAELETDLQLPQVEVDAPSLDIDIGGKGKIKMPEVKMPSVKVPKLKGPEVGISLPKVETDVTLPKGKVEVSEGAAAVKLPEAEGTIDGGGLKMHKPKFKMPSMGFSKPDIKGPKVDVDVSMPKVDISLPEAKLHVEKPEVKGGDITISAPEVKIPTGSASLEMEAAELDVEAPTGKVSVQGPDGKLESADRKFQMPKFHMPKFGISLPKGKGIPEAEISVPSVEADIPKTELKAEVTLPSAELETDLQLPQVEVDAPSLDIDIGGKGKIKMPEVKMPSVKVPKLKGPEVGFSLPKVETDVTLPKGKVEVSEGAAAVKLPEAEGTIDGGGLKMHKPKFKMPSMGFSKPDIKGPKVDVDVSMPKVDMSLPEAKLHVEKPEVKGGDTTISAPEVRIPTGSASLELKAPEVDVAAPTGKVSVQGPDGKLESGDRKFQMPKFHMPKFGISLPKGKGIPEAEISVPSVEADIPKTELKAEVTLPSAELETDLQLPQVEVDAPSLDIDVGGKGKIKMPEVKMPSIKVPKLKGPEVGIALPKVETDVTLPKGKVEVSEGAVAVKLPEAEGTIDGGGLKMHKPKFKMPSMGFSKPDIKGPQVDVDVSMPKVDISLPEAKLHVEKPEVKGGDITISAPEVKIPTGSASLELKAPEVDVEAPTGKVSVQGPDVKLESGDRTFQMPKFHMPKFGISLPKGKGIPEAEIGVPSVEADIPKTELKAEVTLPSAELETDLQLPQVEVDAPSLDIDIGGKGKIKMPEVKMPSVKVPKLKEPEVGISLPKVETDVTLPKGKVEVSEGAAAVKLPEAEGTIDGGGLKIHTPKFKMPSMGFSKPDIKGPKVDVDVSMPKVDMSLPEAKLHVEKPEVKGGDTTISAPEVRIPTGSASLELKAPEVDVAASTGKVSVQGPDGKLESGDRKFQMPKFHMPKFGISLPKGKGIPEAEISVPSVEADIPKTELKAEVTLPSAELETDLQLPQVEVDAPSLDIDVGGKGKIKMPEVKMPSIKVPKLKGPEVGIALPKVETDVTLPKGKVEVSEGAAAVKLPEAEGTIDGGGLKMHKPKFKMPSMGFSKPDIKGPQVDVDVSMPKVDISLPEAKLHVEKPEVKGGDITISAPEVKIPTGSASLELKAPEVDVEAPTGKVSVQGPDVKLESGHRTFQMPKFHMPKFGISLPKGKGIPEVEIGVPSVEADIPKTELKAEVTLPSAELETDLQLPQVEVDAPSLDIDIGGKGKIKMPEVKMPSVKVPKLKEPEVGISLPKVETDVTLPKGKVEVSEGAAAVKLPEAEGTIDGGGLKIHKPKFKMPSMGFSKPDIKGPKVDVDVSMPKVDMSLPEAKLHVEKPEVKGGDTTISAPEVRIPTGSASLELKAPEVDVEAPTGKVSVQGPDGKLESGDRKFQMPKFHMPKFGISLPKGKGIPEAEISVPSVEADIPKTELKAEVTLPSAELETDLQLPQVEVDAPSLDIDIGGKGKIKMPEVKMPSVKIPKLKGPEVGISLPKVETDITLPKGKVEVSESAAAVKLPEAEGTIDGGGLKIHTPKFKMPSMGFSKPDIKGPKVDVDVSMPKVDMSLPEAKLHVEKPEVKGGDTTISAPEVRIPTGSASLELKAPEVDVAAPTGKVSVQGPDGKLESGDRKFQMPKFHMPKFGISLPKGKGIPEAEISVPSVEADIPKTELKAEVTLPSAELETDLQLPQVEVDAPSLDIDIGGKGKIKMPEVKMPSIKVPKLKGPEVGISLPKVETDVTLPKGKVEVSEGAAAVKLPEAEGTIDGGGLKMHKPKFKMPSMGFSKPDIKGPQVDVDVSMPKVDISLPEAKLHVEKLEVKGGDITISAPEVKIPTGSASLELKAPEVDIEAPTGKVSVQGPDVKLESGDRTFQMPKFHMPKFGISLPKGKGIPEVEIGVPSVEADIPKTELKAEVTLPSAELETDLQLPQVEVDAPSLDIDIGGKGKIKMPEVKMPSVKVPKLKEPEVGISLPKVETDITLPKGKVEVSEGAAAVKLPEAEGTIDGGGLKIHKPKFKMPSMGFSKPDIKGPKVEVDVSMPKGDISLPEAKLHVEKPEVKGGDITISAPEVKIPTGSASLELKAPEVDVEAPTGKVSVQGPDGKLESGDRKFQMPKFHMPKFGISLPKGKGIPEAEISVPSVEADIPKTELKAEVTLPSAELETDLQLPQVEVDAPSLDIDIGGKGKIKMPEVKMPSVKVPKLKGPEVGISLPKVETDVTLPKGKVEVSEGAVAVKLPEAEGTIDGGGLKMHKPKFKMPSMGFSKPDIKGPKVDVDVSMPKVDISLPEAKLHVEKLEVKVGDITISAPEVKIPTGSASLELKTPEVDVEAPTGKVSVQGPDVKLESGDRTFQMPKFHMPKFGISLPKGKGIPEAEIGVPSVEADIPKTEFKAELTLPSAELETDLQLPQVEVDAPSLDIDIGGKGKIKMPEVKMPSVKVPKLKGPEVGISLPKVETDVTLPKGKVEVSEGAAAVKLPEAEGTIDGGGLKMHKPKFKMPSMGFSKPDIKGPKVDVDVSMPKGDISLPEAKLHVEKPEVKGGYTTISAPEVKIPTGSASLELKAPEVDIEAPTGKVSVQGPDGKLESGDRKFQMSKFHMPKFGISLPKGKGIPEAEISVPSVEADIPKTELKAEMTLPSAELETDLQLPQVEVDAPSLEVEIGGKGKIKMPEVKIPSVKVPKLKGPEVGISLPKVETDVTLPKGKVEVSEGAAAVKLPEAEGTIDGGGLKMHKPKFKMPSMGFSKPDIKGPKVDVDVSMPKVDMSLPEAKLHVEKPEVKGGDTTISAPEVKIPTGSASLELKAPEVDVEAPTGKVSVQGPDGKLESADRKFQMPKFHMPKFGISLPKGKGIPEAEISVPSVEADIPKTALKAEMTLPSAELETDLQLPQVEVDAPSLDVEIGGKGKIKMPEVKMPSVKVPKLKGPDVGISLPKVETDITLPKGKSEVSEGAAAVKLPEAAGTSDGGGLKIHKPKFKMPRMGFSKPDIKVPKIDVDVSMPKLEASLAEAELCPAKPELKQDKPLGDIDISSPKIIIPTGQGSLEVISSCTKIEPPSSMAVQVPDVQLGSEYSKFKMPKVQMPKFGISGPKEKGFSEGEVTIPSMEGDLPKTALKMEITLPSSQLEADITLPELNREAPILDVDVEEKGKIQTPQVKLPSVKPPKLTAPEIGISLPKVEGDVFLPKAKAELPDSEAASKVAEAEGSREKGRMKIHMPKFKMPSMGFSKSDIKGPKIDSDASMPDVHTSLPKVELSTTKPQLKTDEFEGDIRRAAPEVKIPWVPVTVELQAPDVEVQASSGKIPDIAIGLSKDVDVPQLKTTADIIDIAMEAPTLEMESDVLDEKKDVLGQKIKMPQTIRADVKAAAVGIPSVDISVTQSEVSTQDLHGAAKEPEAKGQITKRGSLDGEVKGHFKMPKFKLPSLSWSPKKEASLKTNIKEPLQESNLGIVSVDTGTEPKVTLSEDQGVHTDGNVDIAIKKGQVKRPHLIMPKISLSKTKLPKAEVDIVVEGDGALVQIPDIENSFTTRKVEETEISVKMLKSDIKEIKTFQTDTDISLPKTDIKVSMTKSSFEQKCLETELKGDICLDSASMKSDGTEGEFRMPKLKMPKFGNSDLSGSGITLSKPESDASQFQMTTESEELCGKTQPLQVKSDEEISEEIQTEESQSWFKMPKFKIPSFGRTSKTKKSDAEIEDITGEAHVTELQAEVKSPEVVTISRELDNEKSTSEQKVMLPQKDVRVQKEQQSTTDQLMDEGSFLQSSEKIGRKPSDLEPKTYADIVKEGTEGQSSQTEFIGTIPKMDIERDIPKTEMTIQQPQVKPGIMAVAEIPSTEITMGKKIDASITDPELLQSLDRQDEKMGTEKKSPKKDSQGKESIFKMPTFSVPLFGWSTTKSDAIVPGIESDLEEPAVTLSKVKVDVSITDEDFEIIDFPVEGFEKDLPKEGEVKAEEKEKTSKTKASKFKMPKFANLRSKSQGGEMQIDSPKVQTEVSLVRPEGETSGIQIQDKKPGHAEESFQMPKFKMLKFTHRISEEEKLTSEETMDIKDTADGDISQLQFKTMFPEEKGDDIQKSKVRITTLSEPAIQRPQVGSKFQSTDSSFVDTTMYVHKQVPKEFSDEFLKEKMDTMDNNVQKSIAKITTLKEPDIQRTPLEIKLQPDDRFSSSAPVQVKGSITESKEIKMESKSSFGCGDLAEIQESFSTQIVKESEIPPSEVKTAAFGFSLLKVKIQESHVNLDVPVKLSSTKCMGEIFEDKDHQLSGTGEAAQKAGLSEVKPSDKDITYEYIEGTSSAATLTTLKSFTVDIQSSGEFAESYSEPIEISKSAIETAGETAFTSSTDEVTDEKDSKRSGRFKLWFPSIGFSPTTDDTTSESKPEAQQKVQPDDSSKLDNDTAKETEKAGWFRFPKLGFSSPTKKSKEVGKEKETDSKEGKGEESPTDKNETFFDAQETLALKEKEENETSGDIPSEPIVSSSARTELILLEKGKAEPKHTPEDPSK